MKEFKVWAYDKNSQMSGNYFVPENLANKINKGMMLNALVGVSGSEDKIVVQSLRKPIEDIDIPGDWDNVTHYFGKIVSVV